MKKLTSDKATISPFLALTAWTVLLAFPCFCFSLAFNSFLKQSLKRKVDMIKPQLTNEMNRFFGEASLEFMLQNKFRAFDQRWGFGEVAFSEIDSQLRLFQEMNAEILRKKLSSHMGFEVVGLFYYGPDTSRVSMNLAEELRDSVKNLPRLLLKRLLAFLSRQDQKSILNDSSSKKMIAEMLRKDGEARLADNVAFLLQTLFKTITPVNITPGTIKRTIAARLGKTGPVFYHFSLATAHDGQNSFNLGGYLAVVRAQDISSRQLVDFALQANSDSIFKRRIIRTDKKVRFPDHYLGGALGDIEEDEKSLKISTFAPENFLQQLISSGTILVKNTQQWRNKVLMFEVAVEKRHLQHEMFQYKDKARLSLLFLFIFGSVVFLRLTLFGMNFRISVASKILVAIFFASLLPLSLLFLSYSAFQDYNDESSRQTIRQYLQLRQSILQKQILGKIAGYEKENFLLADLLESFSEPHQQKQILLGWPGKSISVGAYFEDVEGVSNFIDIGRKKGDDGLKKNELDLILALSQSYMQFLYQSPQFEKSTSNIVMALTKGMGSSTTLHDFLRHAGLFTDISRVSKNMKFTSLQLFGFDRLSRSIPETLLILAISQKAVINRAFADLKKEMSISEKWGDYLVDQAIFFRDSSGIKRLEEFSSQDLFAERFMPIVSLCHKLKRQIVWENDSRNDYQMIFAGYEQKWPYIILLRARRLPADFFAKQIFMGLSAFVYLAVVALLVWQLSSIVFIEPIEKIAGGLNKIAAGDLQHRFQVKSGDEFASLSEQLNRMTKGLSEKEKLSQYVSSEVLDVVVGEKETDLQPGGELIEAAILFCEPENFESSTLDMAPKKVVDQLNYFLASCARACGLYHGVIDKLVDDTVMIVFRKKADAEAPALRACKTVLALQKLLSSENPSFPYSLNSGLSCGKVVSGKIGSKTGKLDFTLIGDAVNMAARVKGLAGKISNTRMVVTADMEQQIGNLVSFRSLGRFEIKGKEGKHELFELLHA